MRLNEARALHGMHLGNVYLPWILASMRLQCDVLPLPEVSDDCMVCCVADRTARTTL